MSDKPSQESGSEYIPPNPRDARRSGVPVRSRVCPLTVLLIAASVLVGVISRLDGNSPVLRTLYISDTFFNRNALSTFLPEVFQQGQVWRLLTPMLIHLGPLHLIFNMFWLRDLGTLLERRYGTWRYAALVLLVSVGASVAQYVAVGPRFGGMSGVVYGLFGYMWIQGRMNPAGFGYTLSTQTVQVMLGWLVVCFTGRVGPVANAAHAAGLAIGAGVAWVVARQSSAEFAARRRQFRRSVQDAHEEPLHQCHACGRTERTAPHLEFRVSSVDGEEYCIEHLPARQPAGAPVQPPILPQ